MVDFAGNAMMTPPPGLPRPIPHGPIPHMPPMPHSPMGTPPNAGSVFS